MMELLVRERSGRECGVERPVSHDVVRRARRCAAVVAMAAGAWGAARVYAAGRDGAGRAPLDYLHRDLLAVGGVRRECIEITAWRRGADRGGMCRRRWNCCGGGLDLLGKCWRPIRDWCGGDSRSWISARRDTADDRCKGATLLHVAAEFGNVEAARAAGGEWGGRECAGRGGWGWGGRADRHFSLGEPVLG